MQPVEALNSFYLVNGKIAMYGPMVITQVLRAGHKVTWGECDDTKASVTITRGDTGEAMTDSVTMDEIKKSGIDQGRNGQKEVWKRYPKYMLRYRAFSGVARFIVPDALQGIILGDATNETEAVQEAQEYEVKDTKKETKSKGQSKKTTSKTKTAKAAKQSDAQESLMSKLNESEDASEPKSD